VFAHLTDAYQRYDSRMRAENFRRQIVALLSSWEQWNYFPVGAINAWSSGFKEKEISKTGENMTRSPTGGMNTADPVLDSDLDGEPLDDDEGFQSNLPPVSSILPDADLDGRPLNSPHEEVTSMPNSSPTVPNTTTRMGKRPRASDMFDK